MLETMAFVLSPLHVQTILPYLEALFAPRAAQLQHVAGTLTVSSLGSWSMAGKRI